MPISPAPSWSPVAVTRSATAALAALTLLAGVSACTRAPRTVAASSSSPTATASGTSGSDSSSAAPGTSGSTTAPALPSATSSSTASTAPATGSVTQPTPGPPACTTGALTVTVQRGSGAAGQQFATVRFTNRSATVCSLTGFPGAVLLLNGARLGQPASRSAKPVARVDLGPGAAATAQLTNVSTCNADNSDSVQVIPPNLTTAVVLPLRFRGCNALSVDPVVRS